MTQNTSTAVMARRTEPADSLDFFPTPPWATRALCEHVLRPSMLAGLTCQEPACGAGDMARPLAEYFDQVYASDVHDYGFGAVLDFLGPQDGHPQPDWIITNPPFRLGAQFASRALSLAQVGVAMLVRTGFLESVERFHLFEECPPAIVAQFAERVPMVKGRLDRKASTATSYCWIVWMVGVTDTQMRWIPPCRKQLDRNGDWPPNVEDLLS